MVVAEVRGHVGEGCATPGVSGMLKKMLIFIDACLFVCHVSTRARGSQVALAPRA